MIFAVYADNPQSEVKMLVSEEMAKGMDCGAPLEDFLAHIRSAILDSAIRYKNPTAPRKQ